MDLQVRKVSVVAGQFIHLYLLLQVNQVQQWI